MENKVVNILKDLVSINSENPSHFEGQVAYYIMGLLEKRNIPFQLIEPQKGRTNLLINRNTHQADQPTIIFNGHLDTKPAGHGWHTDPFTPTLRGNQLFGLGAADMKAGIAGILTAFLEIADEGIKPTRNIQLQFVADEEMNSEWGTRYLINHHHIKKNEGFAIVAEPSDMSLVVKSLGNLWLEIKIFGIKAHTGTYRKGVNAIHVFADLYHQLQQKAIGLRVKMNDAFDFFPNINIGQIQGGEHPGNVPEFCSFRMDLRFTNNEEKELLLLELNHIMKTIERDLKARFELSFYAGGGMPAWKIDPTDPIPCEYIQAIKQCYTAVTGTVMKEGAFLGGSDAGLLSYFGEIPSVIFGPGSLEQAHKPNEWVAIDQVVDFTKTCYRLMSQ